MRKRVKSVEFRGTVESRDLASCLLSAAGDAVIVERGVPRMLIMRCPCGCGDDLLVNLDRRTGKAWRLYQKSSGLTLYPSYWRDDACGSHFILWNSRVYWCLGWSQRDDEDDWQVSSGVEELVLPYLSFSDFVWYWDAAEDLGLLPWEVLQACRQMAAKGLVREGDGKTEGSFRRLSKDAQ